MDNLQFVKKNDPEDPRHVLSVTHLSDYEQLIVAQGTRLVICSHCEKSSRLANYHFKYWSKCPHCGGSPPEGWD